MDRGSSTFARVALAVLGGGLALAAIIMFLPTKHGTIQIEINDPAVEVTVNENEKVVVRVSYIDGALRVVSNARDLGPGQPLPIITTPAIKSSSPT